MTATISSKHSHNLLTIIKYHRKILLRVIFMNETDAWNYFLQSGRVNDYLTYLSVQKAKDAGKELEEIDENSDAGDNTERTEYR